MVLSSWGLLIYTYKNIKGGSKMKKKWSVLVLGLSLVMAVGCGSKKPDGKVELEGENSNIEEYPDGAYKTSKKDSRADLGAYTLLKEVDDLTISDSNENLKITIIGYKLNHLEPNEESKEFVDFRSIIDMFLELENISEEDIKLDVSSSFVNIRVNDNDEGYNSFFLPLEIDGIWYKDGYVLPAGKKIKVAVTATGNDKSDAIDKVEVDYMGEINLELEI